LCVFCGGWFGLLVAAHGLWRRGVLWSKILSSPRHSLMWLRMPYAQNRGVRVYYEEMGHGYPLVLQHGLTSSMENWKTRGSNYIEVLRDKYRLILVDARGHGKSGKPHRPEDYAMKHMVGDVVAVLDELGVGKAIFWGYSMGGRIGLAAARYAPERFTAYVIGGNGLSEKDSEGEMDELQGYIKLLEKGVDAWISFLESMRGSKLEPREYEKWRSADLDAYMAYMSYYENIGMTDYLPKVNAPFLFYAGEEDKYPHSRAKACAEIMRNAEFVSLPGLNHSGASVGSPEALPHVLRFLEKVTNR